MDTEVYLTAAYAVTAVLLLWISAISWARARRVARALALQDPSA